MGNKNKVRSKGVSGEERNRILARIKFRKANECVYYKNIHCLFLQTECNPSSKKCQFASKLLDEQVNKSADRKNDFYVKAIVLSYVKKCIYEKHNISSVSAKFNVVNSTGKVMSVSVPAAYCKECDQYIVLKSDFKFVKKKGCLLCQVEDKTPEYLNKHKNFHEATESRVHSLGYNVMKQYGYTFEQRKIILANIMENYNIGKQEILSIIDINISRKAGLLNYKDAVSKWKQDRKFVANYNIGDCKEVIIDKVVIGSRQ